MKKNLVPKEYLGAFKRGHRETAREYIDDEISYTLLNRIVSINCEKSKEALEFLTKFNNEYHKNVIKKGDPNSFHKTDELRKDCTLRDHASRRDILSAQKSKCVPLDQTYLNHFIPSNHEETIIKLIELKKKYKKIATCI